jgi:hypothetical protein
MKSAASRRLDVNRGGKITGADFRLMHKKTKKRGKCGCGCS